MNKRPTKTVRREDEILQIVREYDYHEEDRGTGALVVHYALRLGSVGKPKLIEMDANDDDEQNVFE